MQTPKYSKSTGGFYSANVHGASIPRDAVEVSVQDYAALLAGQATGKLILSNESGAPVLIDPPAHTTGQLAIVARTKRNKLIADTDYVLFSDYPVTTDRLNAVKAYRQALRDITTQPGFPNVIDWPILAAL